MVSGAGRISLLIDSPLRDLAHAMQGLDTEVRSQIGTHTKNTAQPIWADETKARAATRLQVRALGDTARVGVTVQNVFLRAGAVGQLSSGTPAAVLARAVEFGSPPGRPVSTRSRAGTAYKRRMGTAFGPRVKGGNIVYPAARDAIPRFASLWVQTAIRCIHESIEEVT